MSEADAGRSERGLGTADRARLIDEARAAVKELNTQRRDLREAMKLFGGERFDRTDFVRAFDRRSDHPSEAARVNQLNWPFVTLVNQLNTVLSNGAVLGGLRRPDQAEKAPEVYAALGKAGIIEQRRITALVQLNRTRNALTHRYGLLAEAGDVYDAALVALKVLDTFAQDFGGWLGDAGVLPQR